MGPRRSVRPTQSVGDITGADFTHPSNQYEEVVMRRSTAVVALLFLMGQLTIAAAQNNSDSNPPSGPALGLDLVTEGITSPVALSEAPDGSGRLFVVDQAGLIWVVTSEGERFEEPFLDVRDRMVELNPFFDERGLLGLAFHPEYAQNGRFFVYYSAPEAPPGYNHTSHISEFAVSETDPNRADPSSEQILLEVPEPQFNHNAGQLAFGPDDGYLYIALGDGGGAHDVGFGHAEDWYEANGGGNGQDITENLLGSILRIDVDAGDPYGVPSDNPFVGTAGLDEVYAYGFRNPFRFSFDMGGSHELFVGDVGQHLYEEVSVVEKGGNYGWNVKEGTYCFDTSSPQTARADCPDVVGEGHPQAGDPLLGPVIEYPNASQPGGLGAAVIGGYVYRGDDVPQLEGRYLFGDWNGSGDTEGRVFTAKPRKEGMWKFQELCLRNEPGEECDLGHLLLGFGQDLDGEVYVLTTDNVGPMGDAGKVYRLTRSGRMAASVQAAASADQRQAAVALQAANHPNPFTRETTIRYVLSDEEHVRLQVFDMLGRNVALLVDEVQPAGTHEARFEAAQLPSGMYIYRLETGAGVVSGTMQLR